MVTYRDKQAEQFFANGVQARGATMIMRSAADLYAAWRKLEDLPRMIDTLESVEQTSQTRSRWTTKGPGGSYSWEAEVIRDEPGKVIVWRSVEGSSVQNAGSIRFRERGERGTEVKVVLEYVPPGSRFGDAVAKMFGDDPKNQVHQALHRFRQVMETGEIPTAKGQPVGANAMRRDRPGETDKRKTDDDVRDIASTTGGEQ